jgi:hypothetical protein
MTPTRSSTRAPRGLALAAAVLAGVLCTAVPALADPGAEADRAPDPYVDAISPATGVEVVDGANLLGAPDGRLATVNSRFGRRLVLDLGQGEEGVGDLDVHFANPPGTLSQTMDVHFLAGDGTELGQGQLVMIGSGPRVATVDNPSTRPYRYLSILVGVQRVHLDAMRAAGVAAVPSGR